MGNAVFIWGGLDNNGAALGNGAIYYPTTDKWTSLPPDPGSPSPRIMATAVWTGDASNKVIVYGGTDAAGGMVFKDGAVYDVTNNMWMSLPPNPCDQQAQRSFRLLGRHAGGLLRRSERDVEHGGGCRSLRSQELVQLDEQR